MTTLFRPLLSALALVSVVALFGQGPAHAQIPTGDYPDVPPPSGQALAEDRLETLDLCTPADDCPTLELPDFLQQVLRANPEAGALRLEDDRAAAQLLYARGGFDPYLNSGYEYKTQYGGDKINVLRTALRLPLNLPTSPAITFDYRRGLGSSVDPSVATSPAGEARLGVNFEPFNYLTTSTRQARLDQARLEPRYADAVQRRRRNRLLLDATQAYWRWVAAHQRLQISRDLLTLAVERQRFVTREARVGEVPAIDSTEAELATVTRRDGLAQSLRTTQQAVVQLAVFLWDTGGTPADFDYAPPPLPDDPAADAAAVPDDAPEALRARRIAAATDTARQRRPELLALRVQSEQARIQEDLSETELRPSVGLEAQAMTFEAAESPNPTDVKLAFNISQPLLFRQGRSNVDQARIRLQDLSFQRDMMRRQVRADVESALVAIRQASRRVDATEQRVVLSRRLQEAERRRFELGESTLFLVNQREQAFAQARQARVDARVTVLQARATYRWATGTIADPYRLVRRSRTDALLFE